MGNDFKRGIRVYLETSDYGKGLDSMIAANKRYESAIEGITDEMKKMTDAGTNSGKAWKDLERQLKQNENQLKKGQAAEEDYRSKLKQTEKVLNNLSGVSYNELIKMKSQLSRELKDEIKDTDRYNKILEQHTRVSKQAAIAQQDMTTQIGCQGSAFGKTADFINKYWVMITGVIGIVTGISFTFRKLSEDVAHLDDVYADVMKTTNLSRKQVVDLNEQFKVMDTRTAREQLNKLASDAGKLGINGSKNILDFVDAGNQINVALGEDLGEDAIKNIGKLTQTFAKSTKQLKDMDLKGQMLSIGSAINTIGQSSTAQESYLVEFAQRVSGAFSQAGISLQDTLGYASALDQAGQGLEMSATAVQQFVMKVFTDPAKFAKMAGVPIKEFNRLLKEDTNQAIITVLKSLSEKGGFQQLVPLFDQMGLDGARAVGVLSSLASNINLVTDAQRLSNESFKQGTSATKEYGIKNDNLAAKLEKARKEFNEMSLKLGESLNPVLLSSTKWTTYLIKALAGLPEFLKENTGLILRIVAALTAYTLIMRGKILLDKAEEIIHAAKLLGLKVRIALTNQATAAELRLVGAQEALNASMKKNLWGLIASAIAFALVYLIEWIAKNNEASASSKIFNSILDDQKELIQQNSQKVLEEKSNLESLVTAIVNTNDNQDLRNKLIGELREKYPEFLSFIGKEKISNDLLTSALKDVNDQYAIKLQNAALSAQSQAYENAAIKTQQRRIEIEEELKTLYADNTKNHTERISELNKEDLQLQRNIMAYTQHSSKYRAEAAKNDVELKQMNTAEYAQSQLTLWAKSAGEFEKKYKSLRDKGLTDEADYYQKQMAQANKFVKFYMLKRDELSKAKSTPIKTDEKQPGGVELSDKEKKAQEEAQKKQLAKDLKNLEEWLSARQNLIKEAKLKNEPEVIIDGNSICIESDIEYAEAMLNVMIKSLEKKKKLYKQNTKEYQDIQGQLNDIELKKNEDQEAALLKSTQDAYKSFSESTDVFYDIEIQKLDKALTEKTMLQTKYDEEMLILNEATARRRVQDARNYQTIVQNTNFKSEADRIAATKAANDAVQKANKDLNAAIKASSEYKFKTEEEYYQKRQALLDKYGVGENQSIRAAYRKELSELKSALKNKLLTQEEYEKAVKKTKIKAAADYAQKAVDYAGMVADAVTAYHQMELDSLQAQKQKELAAAGDNAEARDKIEKDYAQKELDLKKKQSGADAVIKISQTVAAGALAVVQAFAQLGPVGGAIAAALIGTTTAMQIASIVKQRELIMNTTLESSSSGSGSSTSSGEMVVKQAAEGRWDVIGKDDGQVYRNVPYGGIARTGIFSEPTLMFERGDELIVDNPTLRNIRMNAPWVLDTIKKNRVSQRASGNYNELNADGKNTSTGKNSVQESNSIYVELIYTIQILKSYLEYLKENGIDSVVLLSELERKQALRDKSRNRGSL